jgi:hypothetical protein
MIGIRETKKGEQSPVGVARYDYIIFLGEMQLKLKKKEKNCKNPLIFFAFSFIIEGEF